MKHIFYFLFITFYFLSALLPAMAQNPTASPTATVLAPDEYAGELTEGEKQAPLTVRFESNVMPAGWTILYEWRLTRQGETTPLLMRNDADMEYVFTESGTWEVDLDMTCIQGGDTLVYERRRPEGTYIDTDHKSYLDPVMEQPFVISISDSNLEFPNAFSPNGDDKNDYLQAKQATSRSLVEFEASVYNRSGLLLYRWTDWKNKEAGWDGTYNGRPCGDGAYYLRVVAKGADGRKYNIRKTITLLTGYKENDGRE